VTSLHGVHVTLTYILLSFAEFERELIGERTRDKMSAARKKGSPTRGAASGGSRLGERTDVIAAPGAADANRVIGERSDRVSPGNERMDRLQLSEDCRSSGWLLITNLAL
jgi:DNA invertase Pin-like site-specific DNA recombinase